MDFPMGGEFVQNNDVGRVELFGAVYGPTKFRPLTADKLYPAGTLLARVNGSDDMVPYNVANVPAGASAPIAVLGDAVQSSGVVVQDITVIMTGQVRLARLIVDLSGTPGDVTTAVQDQLKDQQIFALDTFNLSKLDNQ